MAHINLDRVWGKAEFSGFPGIGKLLPEDRGKGVGIADMKDCRPGAGGALKKRCGYAHRMTLPGTVRTICECGGSIYALVGSSMLEIDPFSGIYSVVGTVTSSSGDACLFRQGGKLYLLDGSELYVYGSGGLSAINGYAPLYGKEWDPATRGDINEPLNLVSRKLRVSYRIPGSFDGTFAVGIKLSSIDAVTRGGGSESLSDYSIGTGSRSIVYSGSFLHEGEVIEFWLTASVSEIGRSKITSCTRAETYGGDVTDSQSVMAYGSVDACAAFCTRRISPDGQKETLAVYPGADMIYFAESDLPCPYDGGHVRAVCPRGNGLMVFTEREAYLLSEGDDGVSHLARVSRGGGCLPKDAAVPLGNDPVTVSERGILRWSPSASSNGEYVADCISDVVADRLDARFLTSAVAFAHRARGELWFCDPSDTDGLVLIYNYILGVWYTFTGIGADRFFEFDGEVGFLRGSELFTFDASATTDEDEHGTVRSIVGRVVSTPLYFGKYNEKKRLSRVIMRSTASTTAALYVTNAEGHQVSMTLIAGNGESRGYVEAHVPCRRSRFYKFTLTIPATSHGEICGLTLLAVD